MCDLRGCMISINRQYTAHRTYKMDQTVADSVTQHATMRALHVVVDSVDHEQLHDTRKPIPNSLLATDMPTHLLHRRCVIHCLK